jgi:hypothetical protein
MSSAHRFGIVVAAAAALVACAVDSELGVDEGAHTTADPVAQNDPMNWVELDLETFITQEAQIGIPYPVAQHLELSHPLTLRLQAWADRIDREVRKLFRKRTGQDLVAPRPRILIVKDKEPNGWVSPIPICFSKPLRVGHATVRPSCVRPHNWAPTDQAMIAVANRTLDSYQCSLRDEGSTIVASGADCAALTPEAVLPYATAQFIGITIGDVAGHGSELGVVATLAHELGHYYRAHASSAAMFESFFYEQLEVAPPERPRPPPDNARLVQEAETFGISKYFTSIPGQRLPRGLFDPINGVGWLLRDVEHRYPEGFACHEAAAIAAEPWVTRGGDAHSPDVQEGYLRLESAIIDCAPRIRVAASSAANTLGETDLLERFGRDGVHGATTLREFLDGAAARANTDEAMEREFTGDLARRHLGLYTTEQEADDFRQEWTSRIGLDPKAVLDDTVVDLRNWLGKDGPLPDTDITWDECEALYRKGFVDTAPDGTRTTHFVPLGDLHDPHHGVCYRVFNSLRELQAHGYQRANVRLPVDGPWEPLKAQAKEVFDALAVAPPPPIEEAAPNPAIDGGGAPDANGPAGPLRALGERGTPIIDRY